jgi:prepilin-type N-terminal cleavage/methylation domain-containing protein
MNTPINPDLLNQGRTRIPHRSADCKSALRARGFTLIELLVVLALVLLWVLMLAPGFAHTQPNSRTAQCLSNKRQIAHACAMYSQDWNDYLVPNAPAGDTRGWCTGPENWGTAAANTNTDYYTTNCLARYVGGQITCYKCPGDTIPSDNGDRIRSISMNCMMVGAVPAPGGGTSYNAGWRVYKKYSDLTAPMPAMAWMFCDENMYSLNDGFLQMGLNSLAYVDVPAAYHGGVNCLTFGDAHVEAHRWRWQAAPAGYGLLNCPYYKGVATWHGSGPGLDIDYVWLRTRTSVLQ